MDTTVNYEVFFHRTQMQRRDQGSVEVSLDLNPLSLDIGPGP
jgi:hypothetical protein